jgi:hypothetical protein
MNAALRDAAAGSRRLATKDVMPRSLPPIVAALALALIAVVLSRSTPASAVDSTGLIPLNDLGPGLYLGAYPGGLYENGANAAPADHDAAGVARSSAVQPLDSAGAQSPAGKIVLLSIGMSNTTQEFCLGNEGANCASVSFMGKAALHADVDTQRLVIVDGAKGGQAAATWDSPADANYDRVRDERLAPRFVTEAQVQAAWVKLANPGPTLSLPNANADAYQLQTSLGNVVRAMAARYPNLKLVFLSNRTYAGYATTGLNPEPYAYESGFSVKWLIQAQVDQMRNSGVIVDPHAGDLNYDTGAPWIGWAANLWADGVVPRSDGLSYLQTDFQSDGTHPSATGISKVSDELMEFFLTSPYAIDWFTEQSSVGGDVSLPPLLEGSKSGGGDGTPILLSLVAVAALLALLAALRLRVRSRLGDRH